MRLLSRTEVVLAVPKGDNVYDVYSVSLTTHEYVVYKLLRKMYDSGKASGLLRADTVDVVETLISELPDTAVHNWNVVELGVREDKILERSSFNYGLTRSIYVLGDTNFKGYTPVWTGVDVEYFFPSSGNIYVFPKDKTSTDREEFIQNIRSFNEHSTTVSFNGSGEVKLEWFIAALLGGIRTSESGEDVLLHNSRGTVVETENEWVVLSYHRLPSGGQLMDGIAIPLPVGDPEKFIKISEEIWKRSEMLRFELYRKFVLGQGQSVDDAREIFEEKLREEFQALL